MATKMILPALGLLALTACGGGGTTGTGVDLNAGPATFAELDIETDRLLSYLSSTTTADGDLPTASVVNYDGVFYMGEDLELASTPTVSPQAYLGQVDLDVDFTTGARSATGTANNFYLVNTDAAGRPDSLVSAVPGEVSITGGNFTDNSGYTLTVNSTTDVDGLSVSGSVLTRFARTASNSGPVAIAGASIDNLTVGGTPNWDGSILAD